MKGITLSAIAKPNNKTKAGLRHILFLTGMVALAACGGGAGTSPSPQQSNNGSSQGSIDIYNGAPERDANVRAFKTTVYDGLRLTDRCGGCHTSTSNTATPPFFMQRDDVNAAYDVAMGTAGGTVYIDTATPSNSLFVRKMLSEANGHNCWLETKEACAFYITNRIQNMVAVASGTSSREIPLTAPEDHEIEVFRSWPDTPPASFNTLHNILRTNCASCHVPGSSPQGSPMFAVADVTTAYNELRVNGKVVLGDTVESRSQSRIVVRPRDEDHGCWDFNADGDADCPQSATAILDAINTFVGSIPDPSAGGSSILDNLYTSKALTMADAILASGGNRHEADQIALYEFKTGSGRDIVDVSASSPGVDLRLFGTEGTDYRWLGNFGVEFIGANGKAVANPATVGKFHSEIVNSGAYSIEAWIVPNNIVQEDAAIISYSSASENRNFGLEQNMYNYTYFNRLQVGGNSDIMGQPAIQTPDMPETAQPALQHVVLTYSNLNGRKIYVNGRLNGATEAQPAGTLADWNTNYQFVLGNSDANDRPWRGAVRLVAVHKEELTQAQIRQNFDVGVGEKFYMLFPLRQKDTDTTDANTTEAMLAGIPDSCHIKFEFMQYDSFSYLFTNPTFICLDPGVTPAAVDGIRIKGVWLGINGEFPNAGQAYQNIDVTIDSSVYTTTAGQALSNVGTIIELKNGPLGNGTLAPDQFFLGFEIIAINNSTTIPDPAASLPAPAPTPDPAASPDIGLRTFDEINASLAQMTGIPATNSTVFGVFNQYKQQLPTVESIDTFLPSHQMAIAQLALAYCNQMVSNDVGAGGVSNSLFGGTFDYDNTIDTALGGASARSAVVNKFINDFMNYGTTPLTTQPGVTDVTDYVTATGSPTFSDDNGTYGTYLSLIGSMTRCIGATAGDAQCPAPLDPPNITLQDSQDFIDMQEGQPFTGQPGWTQRDRTKQIVTATCGAVLGSAVMLIQ